MSFTESNAVEQMILKPRPRSVAARAVPCCARSVEE